MESGQTHPENGQMHVERILIVEDDPASREIIASLLASRGYEVETADDGFSALRMAQDAYYDLVFIDYHLPEMDGYALARLMRSLGETTNSTLKMVAITADQFGLAARRGVDSIFDRVLSKPIQPQALFQFVDDLLMKPVGLDEIDSFLADDGLESRSSPSLSLWRARGMSTLPTAAVFPEPTGESRANIESCFDLVDPASADCLLLMSPAGLAGVGAVRLQSPCFLQPLVALDPKIASEADVLFEVGNGDSWTATAAAIKRFARRRTQLRPIVAEHASASVRLAAYMFVSERTFELQRGANGQTVVPYTAGFPIPSLIDAIKQLVAAGSAATRLEEGSGGSGRRMVVSLTSKGLAQLSSADSARSRELA